MLSPYQGKCNSHINYINPVSTMWLTYQKGLSSHPPHGGGEVRFSGKTSPPWGRPWGGSFQNFPPIMRGKFSKNLINFPPIMGGKKILRIHPFQIPIFL